MHMRIKSVKIYQHDLPVKGGQYRLARTEVSCLDSTIVEIVTDTGLRGFGETCPIGPVYQPQHALGARAALQEMGPALLGQNPLQIDQVRHVMDQSLNGVNYAKAAVDIALWDLAGKAYGARVCDLLGGACREHIPSYYAIDVIPPDEARRIAAEKKQEGYLRIQLKVGGRSLEEDIAAIQLVAEVLLPEVRLAVDANRGWTARDTVFVSEQCRELMLVLEQPCSSYEEILSVRPRVHHPLYLDENAEDLGVILRSIKDQAADGFGLKVTRVGGISAMRTIRDVCRRMGLPITCDDSWGGDIIAAACVHLGATVKPRLSEGVWIAAPYIEGHYDRQNGIKIRSGWIQVPEGPGLGIHPDTSLFGQPVLSFNFSSGKTER